MPVRDDARACTRRTAWRAPWLFVVMLTAGCTVPSTPSTPVAVSDNTLVFVTTKSFRDLRDEYVVKQAFDYSCGAAALATLLSYGLDDPISEIEVVTAIVETLQEDEEALRKKEGFSLLDMQRVAQERGYKAQGFRIAPEFLDRLQGPVIVFIRPRGYEHFAVLRSVIGGNAYLADPSRGNVREPLYAFLDMWLDEDGRGIVFVVEPHDGPIGDSLLAVEERDLPRPEVIGTQQLLYTRPSGPDASSRAL